MPATDLDIDQFARLIVDALEAAGVEYLLGGSVALWAWGEMRTTMDVDVVVSLPDQTIERFSAELMKRDMMVPPDIMRDIIAETRIDLPINAIHPFSGYKADIYPVRSNNPLREAAFERRMLVDLGGPVGKVYVHSPEDLILFKLQYYTISRQTKHARDICSILASGHSLDMPYMMKWIERLGLSAIWQEIVSQKSS